MPLPKKIVEPNSDSTDYYYGLNRPYGVTYGAPNPFVWAEEHNLAQGGSPSISSLITYQVDKNGNQMQATTYDWAAYSSANRNSNGVLTAMPSSSGTTLKSVANNYTVTTAALASSGSESISDDSNGYWNAASPTLVHLLARSVTTGSGTGAAEEYGYDNNTTGNMLQERHWDSTKASSLPSSLNSSNASVTQRAFDGYGNLVKLTDPNLNVTKYTLDSKNLYVATEVDASGSAMARTFTNAWDYNLGLLTARTDSDNQTTTSYSYDAQGRQTQIVRPSGWQQNTTYDDANRRVITKKDIGSAGAGDNINVVNYDPLYRVALTQWLDMGNLNATDTTNGTKRTTRYLYSGSNSYQLVSNQYAEATSQSSGNCGNACLVGWTVTKFDQNGRPISSTIYDGSAWPAPWGTNNNITGTTTTSYSTNITTVTDAAGKARQQTMDALGRLTKVVEDPSGLNYTTSYSYDVLGDLASVTQAAETRSYLYDSLGRLTSATNPESGKVAYTYDSNSNLLTKKDNLSVTTSYVYDALNRPTSKSYSGSTASITPNVAYTYCNSASCGVSYGVGHLQSITTAQGNSTSYTSYTPDGYVGGSTPTIGGQSYPLTYSYLLSGSLGQENYPSGRQITYSYLYVNRPQAIAGTYTTGGTTTNTTYVNWMGWLASTEVSRSLGSLTALITNLSFNSRLQLTQFNMMDWNHADNSPYYVHWIWYYNYGSSNNNGNLLSMTAYNSPATTSVGGSSLSPAVTTSFTYDGVNRLASVTDSSYARSFCYDAYGNSWVTNSSGYPSVPGNAPKETGGTCPAGSGATPYVAGKNQLIGVSYDGNGNETSSIQGNTAVYDAEGRVSSVLNGSTTVASYQYDGDGRRVQKTTSAGTTNYLYDASGALVAEYAGAAVSKEYIRFHSEFIPSNVDLVAVENAAGNGAPCGTCFITPDYLGNVRMVTDNAGNAFSRHDYLPFGEETIVDGNRPASGAFGGADGLTERFTGKERDSESGLDYFGARYYGAALGRFTSADDGSDQNTANPQSWNLYSYVRNNPLANVDPSGNDCVTTSDQTDRSVSVTVTTGTCGSGGGTYVAGTVDASSLTYNGTSVGYSYSPYDSNATFGSGTLNLGPAPSSDISPFGLAVIQSVGRQTNSMYGLMGAFAGGSLLAGGGIVAPALGLTASGAGLTTIGSITPLLPAVPSALEKLQKIGLSLEEANQIVESPDSQKLVDNLNSGNINVIKEVGGKLVRITLDPTGNRIISAGQVRANSITNGIANGRFTPR